MTLRDLTKLQSILALRRVFARAGLHPITMYHRIIRGSPELTDEESNAILRVLADHNLSYASSHEPTNPTKKNPQAL